jgi:hypothetical protein
MISSLLILITMVIIALFGLMMAFRVGYFAVFFTLLIYSVIIFKLLGK